MRIGIFCVAGIAKLCMCLCSAGLCRDTGWGGGVGRARSCVTHNTASVANMPPVAIVAKSLRVFLPMADIMSQKITLSNGVVYGLFPKAQLTKGFIQNLCHRDGAKYLSNRVRGRANMFGHNVVIFPGGYGRGQCVACRA